MRVRFTNIEWDTGDDSTYAPSSIDLPTTVEREIADDVDLDNEGADVLSDEFGYCVFSFDYILIVPRET